jgi:hypothetical protein
MKDQWVWVRVGDVDEYHKFDSVEEADDEIRGNFRLPPAPQDCTFHRDGCGLNILPDLKENNYVSLYWGDTNAQSAHALSLLEQRAVLDIICRKEE